MSGRTDAIWAAKTIVEKYGFTTPPIPVELVAEKLNIEVVYEMFQGDTSGLLIHNVDGSKTIGVNTFHPRTRQRFTIAHEIGHASLHLREAPLDKPNVVVDKPREVLFRDSVSSTASDAREIQANAFAAELLMPEDVVLEAFRQSIAAAPEDTAAELIETLASKFEVSPQAMSYRLINLNLVDPA